MEHLSEGSFLYEQRRDLILDDQSVGWAEHADTEKRLEAHLDALVLGEDVALAVSRQRAEEGDAGELYLAVRAFCRRGHIDAMDEAIGRLEVGEQERTLAASEALALDLPDAWTGRVKHMLSDEGPKRQVAAHVIGYRRIEAAAALQDALAGADLEALPIIIRSLGRLHEHTSRAVLFNTYLQHAGDEVRRESALALLRLGEPAVVDFLRAHEGTGTTSLLALGGGAQDAARLSEVAPAPEQVLALGVLGRSDSIPTLLGHLAEPVCAEAAALSLALVTGFAPREDAFVPEVFEEDELFEDELEAYRRGGMPLRPDGKPYGESIERLSQDPEVWGAWWGEHHRQFHAGVRYRLGEPVTPLSLVQSLKAEWLPHAVRQHIYEELVIRYHIDAPFEADLPVIQQLRVIGELEAQARTEAFRPGRWYFAGQMLPG